MTKKGETYFEIKEGLNFIRIEIIAFNFPNAKLDWDRNSLNSKISTKAGAFKGEFGASLMTVDFQNFLNELEKLYVNLEGVASFKCLEDQIRIEIIGDGIGHFKANCELMDTVGVGNKLEFNLAFDQTQIPQLIDQIKIIISEFPLTGKLNYR